MKSSLITDMGETNPKEKYERKERGVQRDMFLTIIFFGLTSQSTASLLLKTRKSYNTCPHKCNIIHNRQVFRLSLHVLLLGNTLRWILVWCSARLQSVRTAFQWELSTITNIWLVYAHPKRDSRANRVDMTQRPFLLHVTSLGVSRDNLWFTYRKCVHPSMIKSCLHSLFPQFSGKLLAFIARETIYNSRTSCS